MESANGSHLLFYVAHNDFELANFILERVDHHEISESVPFVEMVTTLLLIRRHQYYYYMFIVPADLLLFMIPVIHLLPPNKDSKIVICK